MNKEKLKRYESPNAEVIEIETQGVLCVSGDTASASANGGINGMSNGNTYGW